MGMIKSITKTPLGQYFYRSVQQAGALPTMAAIVAVIVVYLWMVSEPPNHFHSRVREGWRLIVPADCRGAAEQLVRWRRTVA